MKRVFYLLMLTSILIRCTKDEPTPKFQIKLHFGTYIYDTIYTFSGYQFKLLVESDYDINSYLWDFGDSSTSIEASPKHIYNQHGLYKIILKIKVKNEFISKTQYVRVYGMKIKSESLVCRGLYVHQYDDSTVISLNTVENQNNLPSFKYLEWRKFVNNLEVNRSIIDGYSDFELDDFENVYNEPENSFLLLTTWLNKIDINGSSIMRYFSYNTKKGNLFRSLTNKYYLSSYDYYKQNIFYDRFDLNGRHEINYELLYNNATSNNFCQEAQFISDSTYLLLFTDKSIFNIDNDTASDTKLIKKSFNSNSDTIFLKDFFASKIKVLSSGYLLFGHSQNNYCSGCDEYIDVAKVNLNFKIEWRYRFVLTTNAYKNNDEYRFIILTNDDKKFYVLVENVVLIFNSEGGYFTKTIVDFQGCAVKNAVLVKNNEILAIIDILKNNGIDSDVNNWMSVIVYLDENGNLVK